MNLELSQQQDVIITPQERRRIEMDLNQYIDHTISAPDTMYQRNLSQQALDVSRQVYDRNFNHPDFFRNINRIALGESQPTFARIAALTAISAYKNRFREQDRVSELDIVVHNLVTVTDSWAQAQRRQTGFDENAINMDVSRRQLLIYAAAYNALDTQTPVDNRTEEEYGKSKWLRVASDLLKVKPLQLRLPFKETITIENNDPRNEAVSSGYPYVVVTLPPNHLAKWRKFDEASAYGSPIEKAVFSPRGPAALVCVETERIYTPSDQSGRITRNSRLHYLRLPPLPAPQAVEREMMPGQFNPSERTLLSSEMINNMSYVIAMRSIKDVLERRRELEFGDEVPSRLVERYIRTNVGLLREAITDESYLRRVNAGLPTVATTKLGLAVIEHRNETGEEWADDSEELLAQYLIRAAVSLAIRQDRQTRSFDDIHKLVVRHTLRTQPIGVLVEFADIFLEAGERSFLNDTEHAYIEQDQDNIRAFVSLYKLRRIERSAQEDEQSYGDKYWSSRLRRFLYEAMRVRFETIRDIPIADIDSVDWGDNTES